MYFSTFSFLSFEGFSSFTGESMPPVVPSSLLSLDLSFLGDSSFYSSTSLLFDKKADITSLFSPFGEFEGGVPSFSSSSFSISSTFSSTFSSCSSFFFSGVVDECSIFSASLISLISS